MKSLFIQGLSLCCFWACLTGVQAQEVTTPHKPTPARGAAAAGEEEEVEGVGEEAQAAKTGVRFVFKDLPPSVNGNEIFMMLPSQKYLKVPYFMGIPGPRLALPKGVSEVVLTNKMVKGKLTEGDIIARQALPAEGAKKYLGMLIPLPDGKYKIFFLNEDKIEPSSVIFLNFTTAAVNLKVGEKLLTAEPLKPLVLQSRKGKGVPDIQRATLYCKDEPTGKWTPFKDCSLQYQPTGAEINLFVWNKATKVPDMQRLIIMPDEKKAVNRRGAKPIKADKATADEAPAAGGAGTPAPAPKK